jgi:hypothetical protein
VELAGRWGYIMRLTGDWKLQNKKELTIFVRDIRDYQRISIDGFMLGVSNIVIIDDNIPSVMRFTVILQ